MGGGERAAAFNAYVCVGELQRGEKYMYICETQSTYRVLEVYLSLWARLWIEVESREEAQSWDATNQTLVTCGAGNWIGVQDL